MDGRTISIDEIKTGTEIEMVLDREKAAWVVAKYFRTNYIDLRDVPQSTEDYTDQFQIIDNRNRQWKIVMDPSIDAENNKKAELVTPIIYYSDIPTLKEIAVKLKETGAVVNKSCGMHEHTDALIFTPKTLLSHINNIVNHQDMLIEMLKVHPERLEHCQKWLPINILYINNYPPTTLDEFRYRYGSYKHINSSSAK